MKHPRLHKDFCLNDESFSTKEAFIDFTKYLGKSLYLFVKEWFNDKDFIVVNTFGSTGKPKVISLKKHHLINSAKATGAYFSLPEKTRALGCLSMDYIAGKMMLVRAMVLGWQIDLVSPAKEPLKNNTIQYDFAAMVPLQVQHSLEKLNQIKTLIIGGAPISSALQTKLQTLSTKVYLTYGMTETCTHIAVKPIRKNSTKTPLFQTLPDIKVSADERSCLVIDAPLVTDSPVVTNDLVEIYSSTSFEWLGRYDHIINSGGVKLIPEQIEQKLGQIIHNRFFVYGFPDDELGEKLAIIIEKNAEQDVNIAVYKEKMALLKSLLAYEKPKEWHVIKSFLETPTGKIDKRRIVKRILAKS